MGVTVLAASLAQCRPPPRPSPWARKLASPDPLVSAGLLVLLLVVFVESGLLIGFFLPGDSLLFTAGLLIHTQDVLPLWLVLLTVPLAAIAGDQVGYAIGRSAGPRIFNRPDSRLFQQEYVDTAYGYFERYGARTIVLALRPGWCGPSRRSSPASAACATGPSSPTTSSAGPSGRGRRAARLLPRRIEFVADHVEPIILGIVALSVLPIVVEVVRARREHRSVPADGERELPRDVATD